MRTGTILAAVGSDEWGSGFNFTVEELDSDGNVVSRTESGEHTWENYEGVEETRSFEFKYDADWNLIEGTETHGDGTDHHYLVLIGKLLVRKRTC